MSKFTIIATPIQPKNVQNLPSRRLKRMKKGLKNQLTRKIGPMLVKDMEKTVANWHGAPNFVMKYTEPYGGSQLQLDVFPKGKHTLKWKRISEGTGPRVITAKNPSGKMTFKRDYSPKTTASGKYGGSGKKSGRTVHWSSVVHTIEPRKFTARIVDKRENQIVRDLNRVIRKA